MGAAVERVEFFACSKLPKPKEVSYSGTLLEHSWVGIGGKSCKDEGGEEGGTTFKAGGFLGGALSLGDLAVVFIAGLDLWGPMTTTFLGTILGLVFFRNLPIGELATGGGEDIFLGGAGRTGDASCTWGLALFLRLLCLFLVVVGVGGGPLMANGNPTLLLFLSELTDCTLTQI